MGEIFGIKQSPEKSTKQDTVVKSSSALKAEKIEYAEPIKFVSATVSAVTTNQEKCDTSASVELDHRCKLAERFANLRGIIETPVTSRYLDEAVPKNSLLTVGLKPVSSRITLSATSRSTTNSSSHHEATDPAVRTSAWRPEATLLSNSGQTLGKIAKSSSIINNYSDVGITSNTAAVNTAIAKPLTRTAVELLIASTLAKSLNTNDAFDDKRAISKHDDRMLVFKNCKFQRIINGYGNKRNQTSNLKLYLPSNETRTFFNNNFETVPSNSSMQLIRLIEELKLKSNQLNESNYLDVLLLFADIEDLHCEQAMLVYNRKAEKIEYSALTGNYIINIPNINDSRPSIAVYSRLKITSPNDFKTIYGSIVDIQPNHIVVEFKQTINTSNRYDVHFLSNRTTFRMEKLAIELMREKGLVTFMFPNKDKGHDSSIHHIEQHFTWYNKSVAKNLEQRTVIENIYHGTSYPYPYILFGPPGTGKTTTLVESILQLWKNKIETRILIVATSNFACNVISKRLLEFLPKTEIFRLFAKSQEVAVDKIDTHVLKASNLECKTHYNPKPSELYSYRIIVATLTSSGRLIQDGFKSDHFTHLFIDECGSCTEGSALIPIAGLISSQNTIKANIILAGDPLQLGPVIQSKYAEDLGYGVSMIERLMQFSLYLKDDRTGDYNNKFITKLRLNYRSHKDILHISNQLFYNNELKAFGSKDVTDWIINWKCLQNPKFPIMFQAVFGESLSENGSPSLFNKREIHIVISYLNMFVNKKINGKFVRQSDIAVITPYRKQNQKIRALCDRRKWKDVEVASVEAFQGNEKSIIIFSTVRSNVDTMGFLSSERRLNVALTRAQACLIIIGDPKVLMKDKCWYHLIKFCHDNNAICGEKFDFYD